MLPRSLFIEHALNPSHPLVLVQHFSKILEQIQEVIDNTPLTSLSVFLLNVDNFRNINTLFSNDVGNNVLSNVAQMIPLFFKKNNIFLIHKSADEFIILLQDLSPQQAMSQAHSLLKQFSQGFCVDDYNIDITGSIGISRYPDDARNAEQLLSHADIALHRAKELGKNRAQFFNFKLGRQINCMQQLQKDVVHALERNELVLLYQPQFDLQSQRIIGVECLLRWVHPQLGNVPVEHFIPLIERTNQINKISDWLLKKACKQAKSWQELGANIRMSVNVSPLQLCTSLQEKTHIIHSVEHALKESQLEASLLELEITESTMIKKDGITQRNLKKLKELGVRIACDDFGVGYTTFSRLKKLPLDTLKIDRSLIRDIISHAVDRVIVQAIITIAQQLHATVVAEGVETEEQLNILKEMRCDAIQGYFFSKPITVRKIEKLLSKSLTYNLQENTPKF